MAVSETAIDKCYRGLFAYSFDRQLLVGIAKGVLISS